MLIFPPPAAPAPSQGPERAAAPGRVNTASRWGCRSRYSPEATGARGASAFVRSPELEPSAPRVSSPLTHSSITSSTNRARAGLRADPAPQAAPASTWTWSLRWLPLQSYSGWARHSKTQSCSSPGPGAPARLLAVQEPPPGPPPRPVSLSFPGRRFCSFGLFFFSCPGMLCF